MVVRIEDKKIEEADWQRIVNSNPFIRSLKDHENLNFDLYDYALLNIGGKIYGRLLWDWEKGEVGIEVKSKYLLKIYKALENIAFDLEGKFYIKKNEIFDSEKHLPILSVKINRDTKYFESHNLDNIRWIAIREEDRTTILEFLKLEESKVISLKDGIDSNDLVVTPCFSGWTFIMGDKLSSLFINGDEISSKQALTNLCKLLQKMSKRFIEIQYFEHQDRSSLTGYFKANNGKLNFGYWKSESEEFSKGRVPKELKNLHPTSAHEVASIWSIDPLDFVFLKEMAEGKSSIVSL